MTINGHGLEKDDQIIIDFPLKGEWMAPNTPGKKVPSHGTDQLGQRYAIDLLQVNWDKGGIHFYNGSKWRYHLVGVPLNMCYCWGKEVYAPLNGRIIEVADGCDERKRVRFFTDLLIVDQEWPHLQSETEGGRDSEQVPSASSRKLHHHGM